MASPKHNTGDHAPATRSDYFFVDPRAILVDWSRNASRAGEEPPVDDDLKALARDMMPRVVEGTDEAGSSGQLNPILCRLTPENRPEVMGGFRRLRAALWLVESGTCPDFRVKYTVTRMNDAEAALLNLSENLLRSDPKPVQLAHAVRALTEGHGLTIKAVAGRLKRSDGYLAGLLELLDLPKAVQLKVAEGTIPVDAARHLSKLPAGDRDSIIAEAEASGSKITTAGVKARRREADAATPVRRGLRDLRAFLDGRQSSASADLASALLDWLDGTTTDATLAAAFETMVSAWPEGVPA